MVIFENMDDAAICVEVIFNGGKIPYERHLVGNVEQLTNVLSKDFLEERAACNGALSAIVQNVYFRTKQNNGPWRSEFRLGNQSEADMESFILKGESENE